MSNTVILQKEPGKEKQTEFFIRLKAEYSRIAKTDKITKRAALRVGITNLLRDGVLVQDDKLPSEIELTDALDVSLGTVQAALHQLKDLGLITRRRGDGTRVTGSDTFAASVRHFRFRSLADNLPAKITDDRVRLERTTQTGPWSNYFPGVEHFIVITRILEMNGRIPVFAQMHLDEAMVAGILDFAPSELKFTNIRLLLSEKFNLVTAGTNNLVKVLQLDVAEAEALNLQGAGSYYEIIALAHASDRSTVYHQRLLTPVKDLQLEF